MSEQQGFLAAIAASPHDDVSRLVYADWLQERGDPRGEFIRLQVQAEQLRPWDPRRFELLRQAHELLLRHERQWLGPWYDRLVRWRFHRGFIDSATVTVAAFLDRGDELFRQEPIYRLGFVDEQGRPPSAEVVPALVENPAFGHIRSLDIMGAAPIREPLQTWHANFLPPAIPVTTWLRCLAGAAHVRHLQEFVPGGRIWLYSEFDTRVGIELDALTRFCQASHLRSLRALDLSGCPVAEARQKKKLVEAIAEAPFARRLRRLSLEYCRLTERGLERLAQDRVFGNLRRLDVNNNRAAPNAMERLLHSRVLSKLVDIHISDRELAILGRTALAKRLKGLLISGTDDSFEPQQFRDPWKTLIEANAKLTRLGLWCHDPGAETFELMRTRRWLRHVQTLEVRGDSQFEVFENTGSLENLLRDGALPRLTRLLTHEVATRQFVDALSEWKGLGQLEQLSLTDDYYGRGRTALLTSPHLTGRLRQLQGILLETAADVDRFVNCRSLSMLRILGISFVAELDAPLVERLFRTESLANVEMLTLGFYDSAGGPCRDVAGTIYRLLADPRVLPRLRQVITWTSEPTETLAGLRQRLGPGLKA